MKNNMEKSTRNSIFYVGNKVENVYTNFSTGTKMSPFKGTHTVQKMKFSTRISSVNVSRPTISFFV